MYPSQTIRILRSTQLPRTACLMLALVGSSCSRERPEPLRSESRAEIAAVEQPPAEVSPQLLVHRGEQLVRLGGCGDCHTPMAFDPKLGMPVPQRHLALSGHPEGAPAPSGQPQAGDQAVIGASFTSFKAPFGVVYASNLTPDPETGLGSWTREEFIATMRSGHRKGTGRVLLPPMPWQNLSNQPEADLNAMFAYLQSLAPIKNRVPQPEVPEPAIAAIAKGYELARAATQEGQ